MIVFPKGLLCELSPKTPRARKALCQVVLAAAVLSGITLWGAPKPVDIVSKTTLDNGLRVVVVHSSLAPVVTTVMNYLAGSNDAPPGFPGMAHALEHMMFRGSPDLSADQLTSIAAAMGGDFNAETQQSVTQYFFTVPKQDLDVVLHIEAIRMRNVLSTDASWDRERGAIEQEVAGDLSDAGYILYKQLLSTMFRATPYEHDALGTLKSFDATTGAMLKQFQETWYAPNNAILVIAGGVDPAATIAEVRSQFGAIPRKKLPARQEVKLHPMRPKTLRFTTDMPYGMAVSAFRWPGINSPDFAAAQVLADVLDSPRGSLRDIVSQGDALSARFSFDSFPEASLGYVMATFPTGEDGTALLRKVREALEQIARNGIAADLIEAAKRHEVAGDEFQKNSISELAKLWSQALAVEGRDSPAEDTKAIENVTPRDVRELARRLLHPRDSISAILMPQSFGQATSSPPVRRSESFAATKDVDVALPTWAEKVNRLAIAQSSVHPEVATLPNGLRLIVQPETVSDTISVFGHIENNSVLESSKGKEGVSEVLDEMLSNGTESLSRIAFQKALDNIGADESAGTDFSLEVLASDFDRGVALLTDNELHPALRAKEFKIIRRQIADSVEGELASPAYRTQRALKAALLPKDDPDLRHATPESVSSLSLADVRNYYRRVFRPDLTTIVVIGHVTTERARAVIEHYFGAWKSVGPKPGTVLPPVPINRASNMQVPNASRVQADVTLAETLPVTRTHPDYYALNLGSNVLDGGFYASRPSRDLRENTGLVYSVSSALETSSTRALYSISYGCAPGNVSKARAIVERDLKQMQTDAVPEETLNRAKAFLLQQIPLSESSVHSIADGLILRATNELPLTEPFEAAREYLRLTPQQVQAAFARWIRPTDFVQVTEGPKTD